jgi:eukaryotic-like serine/threonine-protein kinase
MTNEGTLNDQYQAIWETQNLAKTISPQQGLEQTIPLYQSAGGVPLSDVSLPLCLTESDNANNAELRLGIPIGEGGMGLVRLAEQLPLHREVAVKTLREGHKEAGAAWELLREAWLTGGLEHPNIIPIYSLGQSQDGLPMLVMKRVEGTTWSEFLASDERLKSQGHMDFLGWHLSILLQVCQAVEFAHSRGILHRDIKPENVMIGSFGEVYLLDWGVAVSCNESDRGLLPLVSEVDCIAGTPRYMAPEMAAAQPSEIGPQSDVYLLGAVLHEILTRKPPHAGAQLFSILRSAFRSLPYEYPETIPAELAAICHKSMSREIKDRYQSVQGFVQSLKHFLKHRDSLVLSEEASSRLPGLLKLSQRIDPVSDDELYKQFGECRFGFQQALRTWPENQEAKAGLQTAYETMIQLELKRQNYQSAVRYLKGHPNPSEELKKHVEDLQHEDEQKQKELEELQRDFDLDTGAVARTITFTIFAIFFTVFPISLGFYFRAGYELSPTLYVSNSLVFLVLSLPMLLIKKFGFNNEANRRIAYSILLAWVMIFFHRFCGVLLDISPLDLLSLEIAFFGFYFLFLTLTVDRRLMASGLVYFALAPLASYYQQWMPEIYGISSGVACSLAAYAWIPKKSSPEDTD